MLRTLRAARFLFVGPVLLVVLVGINLVTSPGHWWSLWAALGIGLAWLFSLLRVAQTVALVGGLAALITYFRRR